MMRQPTVMSLGEVPVCINV